MRLHKGGIVGWHRGGVCGYVAAQHAAVLGRSVELRMREACGSVGAQRGAAQWRNVELRMGKACVLHGCGMPPGMSAT